MAAITIGLTLDAGALIALEANRQGMKKVFDTAVADQIPITVPAIVIAEWWRGRTKEREKIVRAVTVEPMSLVLAKRAGEGLAAVSGKLSSSSGIRNALTIDAIVMASAEQRKDIVYTSDPDDLLKLKEFFQQVRSIEKI